MNSTAHRITPEIRAAFEAHDRDITITNFKIACAIGMVLMPAGHFMDAYKYPELADRFLVWRLWSAVLIALFLSLLLTPWGRKHYRPLGITLFMVPASFIAAMIYATQNPVSPYYAGLNLVLLVLAFVLHWTFRESLVAATLVLVLYLAASLPRGALSAPYIGDFANNIFFLACTAIIAVIGSYFHSRARLYEFALRYQLDQNRRELEQSYEKLRELDQIKSRFFANISHELRTPLTLLLAPLETLQRQFQQAGDADTRGLLDTMQANGMRLLKLINDLLDLVRLESGRLEIKPEPVAMTEFVQGLASAARHMAEDKRIRLETSVAPELGTVLTDRDKLEKIVLNLVFNALKFTPAGGTVSLRAEKQDADFVLIVRDTGVGIAREHLPHIFDRFWQADGSSKRKYQGLGIGLALVKELVEVQGGRVTVESEEGRGTTFTIRLPYQAATASAESHEPAAASGATASQPEAQSPEWLAQLYRRAELFPAITPLQDTLKPVEASGNGDRPTILVADDEPDMLRFLKAQLSAHYHVLEAVDGQQAVDKAAQFLPDLILLDMMMPEKDGLQACREIRERTSTRTIPVVLLTARADEETKMAALEAGASDFLTKPFSTTELHVRLKNLVESHEYQRRLARQKELLEVTIEKLKDTELQLVQSAKLASLGRMSAGIIHEINNPLNFATTGLFTLRQRTRSLTPEARDDFEEILQDMEDGLRRVVGIVRDLRMFSHPDTAQREQVEVAEVVDMALGFLAHEWRDRVRIERALPEGQTVWANKNMLVQVVVNLLQNSLDALATRPESSEPPTIWIEGKLSPTRSGLTVRDNGPGIAPEHLDKIFDPFFTTKDVGKGMGLGLSICYRIVQEFEGQIRVRSEPGRFCEFTLEFPMKG